jgi:hypothetical protein
MLGVHMGGVGGGGAGALEHCVMCRTCRSVCSVCRWRQEAGPPRPPNLHGTVPIRRIVSCMYPSAASAVMATAGPVVGQWTGLYTLLQSSAHYVVDRGSLSGPPRPHPPPAREVALTISRLLTSPRTESV